MTDDSLSFIGGRQVVSRCGCGVVSFWYAKKSSGHWHSEGQVNGLSVASILLGEWTFQNGITHQHLNSGSARCRSVLAGFMGLVFT